MNNQKIKGIMCDLDIVRLPPDMMDDCFGMYNHDTKQIYLCKTLNLMQQEETVLHEILHHIARTCGLKLAEEKIGTLAYFLTKMGYKLMQGRNDES